MKKILIGVTGGIAAYKACDLVSRLVKNGDEVKVIMTDNACRFVQPTTFEALCHHPVYTDTFATSLDGEIHHISLGAWADVFAIVPATANIIAKLAHGLADDMLSSTMLAATCAKVIAPAMNTHMFENPATQRNLAILRNDGMQIVEPASGHLACGDVGKGKLPDVEDLFEAVQAAAVWPKPLQGKRVLISAGPTQEAIDPVRYLTNHSSGKMGYALARQAYRLGAEVTLLSGPSALRAPYGVTVLPFVSANDLFCLVKERMNQADYIIMSAAVGDYRASEIAPNKIKKHDEQMCLTLVKNPDILQYIGEHRHQQIVCGFAMETEHLLENAKAKLVKKNCHMIVANHLKQAGAGFQTDTNVATLIQPDEQKALPLMSKDELAQTILLEMMKIENGGQAC